MDNVEQILLLRFFLGIASSIQTLCSSLLKLSFSLRIPSWSPRFVGSAFIYWNKIACDPPHANPASYLLEMHAIPNYLRIKVASLITREERRRPIFTNNDLTIVEYLLMENDAVKRWEPHFEFSFKKPIFHFDRDHHGSKDLCCS